MSTDDKRRPGARSQAAQATQDVLADVLIVSEIDEVFDREAWLVEVRDTILQLAATGQVFNADDVRALGVPEAEHPSQWGQAYARLRTEGWIEPVGYAPSSRRARHGGAFYLWRGTRKTQRARREAA